MLILEIPGRGKIEIDHIVFDFNGTLATDGVLPEPVRQSLQRIKSLAQVHVLTADVYGTANKECADLGITVNVFAGEHGAQGKAAVVKGFNPSRTLCVGNGCSDLLMAEICAISVAVVGPEGAYGKLLGTCDIVVNSIADVFTLLEKPQRIIATLRT